jgi:hypothetical protein
MLLLKGMGAIVGHRGRKAAAQRARRIENDARRRFSGRRRLYPSASRTNRTRSATGASGSGTSS